MTVAKGTHNIGPQDGKLLINVWKDGVAAKMGHDLTLQANNWSGSADINPDDPRSSRVSVTVELNSIEVVSGSGGAKALSDGDKGDIKKNLQKVLGGGQVRFQSTGVSGTPTSVQLQGQLTLNNKTQPITINVTESDGGRVTGKCSFNQTAFGIKPFSALLGALKIKDGVDVSFDVQLPTA